MDRADRRAPGTERSLFASLRTHVLQTFGARWGGRAILLNRAGRGPGIGHRRAFTAMDEVFRIRYHRGEVGVNAAAQVRQAFVVPVGLGQLLPVRATGNDRAATR